MLKSGIKRAEENEDYISLGATHRRPGAMFDIRPAALSSADGRKSPLGLISYTIGLHVAVSSRVLVEAHRQPRERYWRPRVEIM